MAAVRSLDLHASLAELLRSGDTLVPTAACGGKVVALRKAKKEEAVSKTASQEFIVDNS